MVPEKGQSKQGIFWAGKQFPVWFYPVLTGLSALLLIGIFSPPAGNSDFWWHLKTGQYIAETRSLPFPDPFSYTTSMGSAAYAGEERTRYFNLTHEWLAQLALYAAYRVGGFPAVVFGRAVLLTGFCALIGWWAWLRTRRVLLGIAAVWAAAGIAVQFASDRPYLVTFVLLAFTIVTLETRRRLWLLPVVILIWANCHGGFFLGWLAMGAYVAESLWQRKRERSLWIACAAAVIASGVNPSGFRVLEILTYYRGSQLTSRLLEWAPPNLTAAPWFAVLLIGGATAMLWKRRSVRVSDWLLFAAFAAAALTAQRNMFLIAAIAPVMLVSYAPRWKPLGVVLGVILIFSLKAPAFAFYADEWRYPAGGADFLRAHDVRGRMFNTYEYGGYLMWRLGPERKVFIDGRALNESVFADYGRILYNADGQSMELLNRYGVDTIVMNTFEYTGGLTYVLAPLLADPQQTEWKLVYSDAQALIFMKHPPAGVAPLDSMRVFDHMEAECGMHIERDPQYPRCARALGQVFAKVQDFRKARLWLGRYLSLPHAADPEAQDAFQKFAGY